MLVTNTTNEDYWFGPLHLDAGIGETLTVDDTSATSLYLTDDAVADALNNCYATGRISVTGAAQPFPRPTGVPQLLHGDGSPEGRVFAPQGSAYMRRDNTGASSSLYVKTSGVTLSTGWLALSTSSIAVPTGVIHLYGAATAPTDWLLCDGSEVSRTVYSTLFGVIGTTYGGGDGTSTFNLPDLRGRVPVGFAVSGGNADVSTLGANEGSGLGSRRPKHPHSHALTLPDHVHAAGQTADVITGHQFSGGGGGGEYTINATSALASTDNPTTHPAPNGTIGAAGTANDAPAYIVVNYIIKT